MSLLPIIKYPAEVLRKVADEVKPDELDQYQELIRDMIETLRSGGGLGLAAPQVGVGKQIIVYKLDYFAVPEIGVLINPRVLFSNGKMISENEGCLSIPNIRRNIKRARIVIVKGLDIEGHDVTVVTKKKNRMLSIILQHEIDHLNGITILQGRRQYRHG